MSSASRACGSCAPARASSSSGARTVVLIDGGKDPATRATDTTAADSPRPKTTARVRLRRSGPKRTGFSIRCRVIQASSRAAAHRARFSWGSAVRRKAAGPIIRDI
ncbi:hypothetical protein ACFV2H_51035 [Streptomyces sp. NPDC059629]|uniref:hypothetical protein n=1 Tax=Streptomyces sp. NPDC059629 TaxID=3346889 RepID=UPI00369E528B